MTDVAAPCGSAVDNDAFPEITETVYGVKKRLNFMYGALSASPDARILDVGCGSGELLSIPLARKGFSIIGLDSDDKSLEHGRSLAAELQLANVTFQPVVSMAYLEPADVVIASEVIEHVDRPDEFLAQLRERLLPGGLLLLTLPNGRGPFEVDQWLWRHNFLYLPNLYYRLEGRAASMKARRGLSRSAATCNEHDPHVNFFTLWRIEGLLSTSGFRILRFEPRTFIAGSFSSLFVQVLTVAGLRCRRLLAFNASVANHLPPRLSSGWMFVCQRDAGPTTSPR